jgi:hypothetical protein
MTIKRLFDNLSYVWGRIRGILGAFGFVLVCSQTNGQLPLECDDEEID